MKKLSLLKLGIFVPVISMCLIFSNVVFAKEFKVYAAKGISSTGINLKPGQILVISVDEKDTWSALGSKSKYISNANGLGNPLGHNFGKYTKSGFSFLHGSLVGTLDGGKSFFLVGTKLEKTIENSGTLSLYYWDSHYGDNSGYVTATIHVKSDCNSNKISKTYTRTGVGESLVAPFTSPSTSTTKSYSGLVEVKVSGTGYSYGMTVNDAFFGVKTGKPLDPQYYQLNIGWNGAPLRPYAGEPRNIANFIKFVDGIGKASLPTYNSNNSYHFVIEVPKDIGRLSFGVSDGGFDENGGQYNIEVYPVKNQESCNSDSEVNNQADSKVDKKLGCFKDQGDPAGTRGRDLNGVMWTNAQMTTEKCQEHCKTRGYAYAGTQYSYQCFCGNSYGRSGTASNCNMPCKGNTSQTCGGVWANSVYKIAK